MATLPIIAPSFPENRIPRMDISSIQVKKHKIPAIEAHGIETPKQKQLQNVNLNTE
jgi:hypothetical protein